MAAYRRVNITISELQLQRVDYAVGALGWTRSSLIQRALSEWIERHPAPQYMNKAPTNNERLQLYLKEILAADDIELY